MRIDSAVWHLSSDRAAGFVTFLVVKGKVTGTGFRMSPMITKKGTANPIKA